MLELTELAGSGAHCVSDWGLWELMETQLKSQFPAEIPVGLGAASKHDLHGTPGRSAKAAAQPVLYRWRSVDVLMFQFEQWDLH